MNNVIGMGMTLGLDVSKRTIDACLLGRDGEKQRTSIPNCLAGFHQLISWLSGLSIEELHICLEPTGRYSRAIAAFLHGRGYKISQVNSYTVLNHGRSKNQRSKSDRIDAYLLADYCQKHNPPTWVPASQSYAQLRDLHGRITELQEMIQQEKNRLEAGFDSELVRQEVEEHVAYLMVKKQRLETAALELVRTDQAMERNYAILSSIVGIGKSSALSLLAFINFENFANGRKLACFVGITPAKYESGTSVHKREVISRKGNNDLRRSLYFPAMVAMQHNPQLLAFAERLKERGKPPKAIICAVMRKLIVLASTLIRKQEYYDATKGLATA